jgi:uncharacterized membrane protein YpjA
MGILKMKLFLWMLFFVNLAGTIYGYMWYWNQIQYTTQSYPWIFVLFVPDSPTASLFFTLSLLFMLYAVPASWSKSSIYPFIRSCVEIMALVTSVKYGVWAVTMILASASLGNTLDWQDWMLMISHTGMAVEALLFAAYYTYRSSAILAVACWTISNDLMDYGVGVYPWLTAKLVERIDLIALFTIGLSIVSIVIALIFARNTRRNQVI